MGYSKALRQGLSSSSLLEPADSAMAGPLQPEPEGARVAYTEGMTAILESKELSVGLASVRQGSQRIGKWNSTYGHCAAKVLSLYWYNCESLLDSRDRAWVPEVHVPIWIHQFGNVKIRDPTWQALLAFHIPVHSRVEYMAHRVR
ncbi:hypothetical protein BDP27DRAFT_1365665 [Rhodocollybia butyracea]|uniref:Uncharacterized protein n=1 Tax=Rhodocollybia butyracea TaxID=206335 RepID=A0A9P5PN71_9AGAR|nr:hypothetical protein BDP27DRAFT_1365665 [Rhodocollybia butyracea]